jgi:hypothetical protein
MIEWRFNPDDYTPDRFELVPPGDYRVRIEDAEEQTSKSGSPMVKMTLKVSGYNGNVWHYMVFMNNDAEAVKRTNDNLGRIFDSFGILQGDLNLEHWKGKVGAAHIKNEPDNKNNMRAVIGYFIQRSKQDVLPMWQEHRVAKINPEMVNPDEAIPF